MTQTGDLKKTETNIRRYFQRGPWEIVATTIISAGVFMLMQPFSKLAFRYSFLVLLAGFICFNIVSHFPDEKE